jgi:hypothetical protein
MGEPFHYRLSAMLDAVFRVAAPVRKHLAQECDEKKCDANRPCGGMMVSTGGDGGGRKREGVATVVKLAGKQSIKANDGMTPRSHTIANLSFQNLPFK